FVPHGFTLPVDRSIIVIHPFFFFQAEDGIRDRNVTGVQTCALPIFAIIGTKESINGERIISPPSPRMGAFSGTINKAITATVMSKLIPAQTSPFFSIG